MADFAEFQLLTAKSDLDFQSTHCNIPNDLSSYPQFSLMILSCALTPWNQEVPKPISLRLHPGSPKL